MTGTTMYELRPPEKINLAGVDTGRAHLSHSALRTFLACEQQFDYHYEQRLAPAISATPLAVGRAFAHALEHSDPMAGARYLFEHAAEEGARAEGNPWVTAPDARDVQIQAMIVAEAARCYLTAYGPHGTREVELRARIRNPAIGGRYSHTHDLLGRVDALSDDGTVMYEDKLAGQIPRSSLAARIKLDRQVSIGCYLAWRTTGIRVERVHYRMTLKPQIRQKQGETLERYLERIADEYATRPDHYLAEEIAERTEADFLRLERELWRWAERVRESRRDGTWPRNTGACHEWGGCRFLALCAGEPGAEHQFVVREQEQPQEAAAA